MKPPLELAGVVLHAPSLAAGVGAQFATRFLFFDGAFHACGPT
ncbi:MAG: hypothetical protein ACYS26_12095 [Planctomycetota bacterium]